MPKRLTQGIGGIAFGALFFYLGVRVGEERASAVENARPMTAKILETSVVAVSVKKINEPDTVSYYPRIRYRYTVDGETYRSDQILPVGSRGGEEDWAHEFLADYPEGETVEGFYVAGDPDQAFLVEGKPWMVWLLQGMGGIFALIGLFTLVRGP